MSPYSVIQETLKAGLIFITIEHLTSADNLYQGFKGNVTQGQIPLGSAMNGFMSGCGHCYSQHSAHLNKAAEEERVSSSNPPGPYLYVDPHGYYLRNDRYPSFRLES